MSVWALMNPSNNLSPQRQKRSGSAPTSGVSKRASVTASRSISQLGNPDRARVGPGAARAPSARKRRPVGGSAGCAGYESGDDVGGVAVEGLSGSVIAHGGAGVGVTGRFLDVAQRYSGVQAAVMKLWHVEGGGGCSVDRITTGTTDGWLRRFERDVMALGSPLFYLHNHIQDQYLKRVVQLAEELANPPRAPRSGSSP